ncbi:MAG: class B sortase [Lachnospiraceae bacterium]|nr:class B sortase [Lachnospiraceae bacterium]
MQKRTSIIRVFVVTVLFALIWQIRETYIQREKKEQLRQEMQSQEPGADTPETEQSTENSMEKTQEPPEQIPQEPEVLSQFQELVKQNKDFVGWITLEGTQIDYPIMQCEDDEYYLHHNFYGEEDRYGELYVRARADMTTPGTNVIIYGHNMRDGAMFGEIDNFKKEKFFEEHRFISFSTLHEEYTYEIMAVFLSKVYNVEDEVFKYYNFYEAETEEEFQDFYDNVKALSLYDTGVTAEFGDKFITLSTCAYHVKDGRMVIVAKQLREEQEPCAQREG